MRAYGGWWRRSRREVNVLYKYYRWPGAAMVFLATPSLSSSDPLPFLLTVGRLGRELFPFVLGLGTALSPLLLLELRRLARRGLEASSSTSVCVLAVRRRCGSSLL